jgi:hypothetical protein
MLGTIVFPVHHPIAPVTLVQALLDDGRARLAEIIATHTHERSRSMMNGGLCERIFDQAKQHLDSRDDPEDPTVLLNEADIIAGENLRNIFGHGDPGLVLYRSGSYRVVNHGIQHHAHSLTPVPWRSASLRCPAAPAGSTQRCGPSGPGH